MLKSSHVVALGIALGALALAHCVRVPPPDDLAAPPQVDELVQRIKCDLYEAVADRLDAPYGYEWLHSWTVQASLNLIVNDLSQIDPGATFTQPLTTKSLPLRVTNMARSWNFGLGAQANNTASRNETVTFTVSMSELTDQFGDGRQNCDFPNYVDLRSDLGLKEWVTSALSPVDDGYLNVGYHKTPKSGAGSVSVKAAVSDASKAIMQSKIGPGIYDCDNPRSLPPRRAGPPSRVAIRDDLGLLFCELSHVVDPTEYDFSKLDGGQVKQIAQIVADIHQAIRDLSLLHTRAGANVSAALERTAIELSVFLDPPIDTISHQVQFIIVWNASASPSWTLLHFKGPSPSGSLFSVTQTKTHTLNLVLGPPSSPDAQGALNALQIGTAVGNALSTGTPAVP